LALRLTAGYMMPRTKYITPSGPSPPNISFCYSSYSPGPVSFSETSSSLFAGLYTASQRGTFLPTAQSRWDFYQTVWTIPSMSLVQRLDDARVLCHRQVGYNIPLHSTVHRSARHRAVLWSRVQGDPLTFRCGSPRFYYFAGGQWFVDYIQSVLWVVAYLSVIVHLPVTSSWACHFSDPFFTLPAFFAQIT